MKIKWTLYRKIQIIVVTVLIIVFTASQLMVAKLVNDSNKKNFMTNVFNTSVLLQQNIEVVFSDARNSLYFIKNQYETSERDDEYAKEYLRILIETKDYITNAFVGYEDGTFVLEPYAVIPPTFDPRERKWFGPALEFREVVWSVPYVDEVTGNLVITGSLFIELTDTYGVVGIDIQLSNLLDIIDTTHVSENGYVLLVDANDIIIADSKDEHLNMTIDHIDDVDFLKSNIITGQEETEKGIYYLRRLNKSNMRLIAFLPAEDLKYEINRVQIFSAIVFFFSLLVGIVISYFMARRITKPIEELTDTMLKSLSGDSLLLYDESTNDEIDTLIQGYNTMATSVNNQKRTLKTVSNRLIKSEKKLQEQYDKVADLAYYDHLTGLPNRLSFEQEVKIMIGDKIPFALYYVDLDNFKYINDTYGHNYGDFVLQIVSKRFKNCCDTQSFGARLSGDEFGVIVTYDTANELDDIARKMLALINEPIFYNELEFAVTGSIGISLFPDDGKSFEDLLANSDIAMYEAKGNSKNQYMIFDQELRSNLINRVTIETNLFSALENNEIYLTYQPLIDFKDKSIKGFEALVRWESAVMGLIYPDVFIPIAEHNLFIHKLGYFVLEEALKFGNRLFDEFGEYYEMNVNVSLIQLHIEDFVEEVFGLLKKHNYPAEHLNLEITESVALESDKKIHAKLKQLREVGIGLSLDDFGTGYSSLSHLLNIQLTHLKIDRTIIVEAAKEGEVHRLIQGIVEFAHAIKLKVVAEGIEDKDMEETIDKMSIDYAQGYLYSRPVKEDEAIQYIKKEAIH